MARTTHVSNEFPWSQRCSSHWGSTVCNSLLIACEPSCWLIFKSPITNEADNFDFSFYAPAVRRMVEREYSVTPVRPFLSASGVKFKFVSFGHISSFCIFFFQRKWDLAFHMKWQVLFSLKMIKKNRMSSSTSLLSPLRINQKDHTCNQEGYTCKSTFILQEVIFFALRLRAK